MDDIHDAAHKQQYSYVSLNPQSTIQNFCGHIYIHTYIHTNKHPRIVPHLLHDYLPIANALGNYVATYSDRLFFVCTYLTLISDM